MATTELTIHRADSIIATMPPTHSAAFIGHNGWLEIAFDDFCITIYHEDFEKLTKLSIAINEIFSEKE